MGRYKVQKKVHLGSSLQFAAALMKYLLQLLLRAHVVVLQVKNTCISLFLADCMFARVICTGHELERYIYTIELINIIQTRFPER